MSAAGEQAAALLRSLRGSTLDGVGDPVRIRAIEQLEGGWSRHSYVATVEDADGSTRRLIVRVRPEDTVLDSDLETEFRTYLALADEPLATPRVYSYEPARETPFGGPFFTMEFRSGAAANVWRAPDRAELEADWNGDRAIATDFVDQLASLHQVPTGPLDGVLETRDFAASVDRWQELYERVRVVRDPIVDEAYAWVRDRVPTPVAPALVHGDYRIGNCLVDRGRISAVIDWELAYVGDPRFDLGYLSQPYETGKFTRPGSALLGAVADREWLFARYEQRTGAAVDREVVRTYTALGALMLIAIMSVGVRVYADGGTDDIRMAWSRFVFPGLRQDLAGLMDW
ncbi:MAG: phosphotransferase family protein [Patulibacter sp.]